MNTKLLTEHHLEFLSLKGGCTGSSESIHVKIPHCWKSHVTAQISLLTLADYATRYQEAVALPSIETETVAEALVSIFSRVGVP